MPSFRQDKNARNRRLPVIILALPESPSHSLIWIAKRLCLPPHHGLIRRSVCDQALAMLWVFSKGSIQDCDLTRHKSMKEGEDGRLLKEEEEFELSHC